MVAIHIRDVPETLRDELANQAREQGTSMQHYLLGLLTREAEAAHHERLLADWARSPLAPASKGLDAATYVAEQRAQGDQERARRLLTPRD